MKYELAVDASGLLKDALFALGEARNTVAEIRQVENSDPFLKKPRTGEDADDQSSILFGVVNALKPDEKQKVDLLVESLMPFAEKIVAVFYYQMPAIYHPTIDIADLTQVAYEALINTTLSYSGEESMLKSCMVRDIRKALREYVDKYANGMGWSLEPSVKKRYIKHSMEAGPRPRLENDYPESGNKTWVGLHPDVVFAGEESTSLNPSRELLEKSIPLNQQGSGDPAYIYELKMKQDTLQNTLYEVLRYLSREEKLIISMYFGLPKRLDHPQRDCNDEEIAMYIGNAPLIARELQITEKDVKDAIKKVKWKLKRHDYAKPLRQAYKQSPPDTTQPPLSLTPLAEGTANTKLQI